MAISSDSPAAREAAVASTSNHIPKTNGLDPKTLAALEKIDTSGASEENYADRVDHTAEFNGDVNTNNEIPTQEDLARLEKLMVLDKDGVTIPFKDLYNGPNVARRVLIIFIRHFFCGNCQEYMRAITASITPSDLLHLPTPTFIAVVGCGSPSLIPMYQEATACPFPIYADPTKKTYEELGMLRTITLGAHPEYMRKSLMSAIVGSFVQSLKQMKGGKAFQGGDYHQVGGEFLFEPVNMATPICSPDVSSAEDERKKLGEVAGGNLGSGAFVEEKRVTWCHRMRNTRDHAEVPELREVLGLDGYGVPGRNKRRWTRALGKRKGTGLTEGSSASASASMSMSMSRNGEGSARQSSEMLMNNSNTVRSDA
ncbi:Thioredoxin-like protein AAED1 [Lachnellula cervina]|uniref:Thioredoxin-like protein AAED1 n=1 Tax=Lachnellula cervina TaxID=1316786 RepID=A0A7D8YNK5_9HELO|nr:Thioredoxin-like protein AAED1 [Lachnellula cervina]